jgi:peroxin-2
MARGFKGFDTPTSPIQEVITTSCQLVSISQLIGLAGLPRRSLLYLFAFSVLLPYVHTRFRNHALSKSWPDLPAADPRRKMWSVLSISETTHSLLATLSFVVFLWKGRYRLRLQAVWR